MQITNSKTFYETIQKGVVFVFFYAEWCSYCQKLIPVVDELQKTYTKAKIVKIDVDALTELVEQYEVEIYPTMIYFKNGKQVMQTVAEDTKENIINKLNGLLK